MRYWDAEGTEPPPPFISDMYKRLIKLFSKRRSKKFKKTKILSYKQSDKTTSKDFKKLWL